MGEGFLTRVKPNLHSANRKFWARNLMTNLVRQRSLLVLNMKRSKASGASEGKPLSHLDHFVTYASRVKMLSDFEKRKPMSVICVEALGSLELYAVVSENNTTTYYPFEFLEPARVLRSSLQTCYHRLDLTGNGNLEVLEATASCVLLPYPLSATNVTDYDGYFTIIDSNWRCVDSVRRLVLPHKVEEITPEAEDGMPLVAV